MVGLCDSTTRIVEKSQQRLGKCPKPPKDYVNLVRTIYKVLEPNRTMEQEEELSVFLSIQAIIRLRIILLI